MPNFKTYIGNEKYNIGCTGQTIYVYDKDGVELARFKDMHYAYHTAISPNGDIFVVKTTDGMLGVYSLERLELIKKFRFSKVDGAQDDNFCFSPDGKEFYNIERHIDSLKTALSVYETETFSLKKRLLDADHNLCLSNIEYDAKENMIYLTGYFRNKESGVTSKSFVGQLINDELKNIYYTTQDEHFYDFGLKALELSGYTDFSKKWSILNFLGDDLNSVQESNDSLAKRWKYYAEKK